MRRLSREDRLRKKKDFLRIMEQGTFYRHPLLTLGCLHHTDAERRMGVSVGKKVGKAVVRNRARRRIREAYRLRCEEIVRGIDLLFFARPRIGNARYSDIEQAMDQLLRLAGLLEPRLGEKDL